MKDFSQTKHRLAKWLQDNRSATQEARIYVAKDELQDLDKETLLHLAAMSFVTYDALLHTVQSLPAIREATVATCKSLGDQLEAKNTAEMRPHAERGKKVIKSASQGGNAQAEQFRQQWPKWQKEMDRLHLQDPKLSFTALSNLVAKKFGITGRAVRERTTDPKAGKRPPLS